MGCKGRKPSKDEESCCLSLSDHRKGEDGVFCVGLASLNIHVLYTANDDVCCSRSRRSLPLPLPPDSSHAPPLACKSYIIHARPSDDERKFSFEREDTYCPQTPLSGSDDVRNKISEVVDGK